MINETCTKTRVTVLVTTYNHERYIEDCITSILRQKKSEFFLEIVVVDDFSSDRTWRIAKGIEEVHPEVVKIYRNEQNLGSRGQIPFLSQLYETQSEFIAFCDGDDYWIDDKKLEKQLIEMQTHPKVGLVHTGYFVLDESRAKEELIARSAKDISKAQKTRKRRRFVQGNDTKHSTVLIRKSAINFEFFAGASGLKALDWILCVAVALSHSVTYLEYETTVHRIHAGGVWNGSTTENRETMKKQVRSYCAKNLPKGFFRSAFKARLLKDSFKDQVRGTYFYSLVKPLIVFMRGK